MFEVLMMQRVPLKREYADGFTEAWGCTIPRDRYRHAGVKATVSKYMLVHTATTLVAAQAACRKLIAIHLKKHHSLPSPYRYVVAWQDADGTIHMQHYTD